MTDEQFRIDLPMLMLWLDVHQPKHKAFLVDPQTGVLLEEDKKKIREYEAK